MDYKKLPDTPWHIGYVKKDEDDPRRHKSRCVYNNGDRCNNPYMLRCVSSSHCKYYAEDWETAERFKASMRIDYKGAGIVPVSIGEVLYGRKKDERYKVCPHCNQNISLKNYEKHIKEKCPVVRKSELKKRQSTVHAVDFEKSICRDCRNFNTESKKCSLFTPVQSVIPKCLFYKHRL